MLASSIVRVPSMKPSPSAKRGLKKSRRSSVGSCNRMVMVGPGSPEKRWTAPRWSMTFSVPRRTRWRSKYPSNIRKLLADGRQWLLTQVCSARHGRGKWAVETLRWGTSEHFQRFGLVRRREGAVELGEFLGRQREVERRPVLAHMVDVAGLGDHDEGIAGKEPGQRHLSRGHAAAGGDLAQRALPQEPTLLDRRIGHDRHPALAAPGQEIPFDAPPGKIVEHLVGGTL